MLFHFSNRQQKELAAGKQLRIALPYPEDWPEIPLLSWAQDHLAVDPAWIRAASEHDLLCTRGGRGTGDVAEQIGRIMRDGEQPTRGDLAYWVSVVLVDVSEAERPRSKYPPQWPGSYEDSE